MLKMLGKGLASQLPKKTFILAGVSTEIYMESQPNSNWGYEQADAVHKALKKNGVNVRRIWLKVRQIHLIYLRSI